MELQSTPMIFSAFRIAAVPGIGIDNYRFKFNVHVWYVNYFMVANQYSAKVVRRPICDDFRQLFNFNSVED